MKPVVNNYLKNVTKSIAFAASDVAKKDLMPNVADFAETNKDFIKATYATLKNPVATFKRSVTALQESKVFKAVDYGIKNTFEDLASGNFYNKERENRDSLGFSGMDISEESWNDLSEFGIDDDWEKDAKKGVKDEITKGDKQVVDAINGSNKAMTSTVVNAVIKSTDVSIKNSRTNMSVIYNQNERLFHGLHADISVVGATLTAMNELHKATLTNLDKNTSNFFTQSIKLDEERNKILKEMLEMQRMSYKSALDKEQAELDKKKKRRNRFSDLTSSGFPDLDAYFENVKKNFADTLGMLNVPSMGDGDSNMLAAMFTSPLKGMVTSFVKGMVPATMRLAAKSLDQTISGVFGVLMGRLSNYKKSDNMLLSTLGSLFGIKTDPKTSLDPSKYHKGPVPFDGMVRKSILDVIPRYLSKIEAYITNRPEEIFDYKSGKFVKVHDAFKKREDLRKNAIKNATADVTRMMAPGVEAHRNTLAAKGMDDLEFKELWDEYKEWMFTVNGDHKHRRPTSGYKYLIKEENFNLMKRIYEESGAYIDRYGKKQNRNNSRRVGVANTVISTKDSLNRQIEAEEREQTILMIQEMYGKKGYDSHGKWKDDKFTAKKASWAADQDEHGYTISNYLYDITKELMWQRDNWTAIGLGGTRGGGMYTTPSGTGTGSRRGLSDINSIIVNPSYVEEQRRKNQANEIQKAKTLDDKRQAALKAIQEGKAPDTTGLSAEDAEDIMKYHEYFLTLKETEKEIEKIDAEVNTNSFSKLFDDVLYKVTGRKFKKERDPDKEASALEKIFDSIDEMRGRAAALASAPAAVLTELIKAADNKIYQSLFKEETEVEDEDGNKKKYSSFSSALVGQFQEVFKSLKESANDVFSDIKTELGVEDFKSRFKDELSKIGGAAWGKFRGANKEVWGDVYEKVVKYSEGKDNRAAKLVQAFDADKKSAAYAAQKAIDDAKFKETNADRMAKFAEKYSKDRGEMLRNADIEIINDGDKKANFAKKFSRSNFNIVNSSKYQNAFGTFGKPFMGRSALSKDELLFNRNGISRVGKTGVYDINIPTHILNSNDSIDLMRSAGFKTGPKRSIASNLADERKAINNISRHAEGTNPAVEKETNKYLSALKSYIPEMAAGGLVGGITSLVLGIIGGPLIGGAVGAAATLVSKSDVINNALFGEKIGENGERAGGIISKDTTDLINKYLPDMTKYGMAGIIPGLITPLGPIGGLMIGGAIGFVKNNETLMNKFFGESGALKLDDKTKKGIAKLIPGGAAGAAAGAAVSLFFGGPFGILGNAVIGSGLGMMATTDEFKEGVLGKLKNGVREGGLLGELGDAFEPLKDAASSFKDDLLFAFEKNILSPIARFVSPTARMLPRLIGFFPSLLAERLSNTIFGSFIRGWGRLAGGIGSGVLGFAGGAANVLTTPLRLLGVAGDKMVDWEVAHGKSNMSAADQIAWATSRNKKYSAGASVASNLSYDDLNTLNSRIGGMLTTNEQNARNIAKNGNRIVGRLKGYRGANGLKFSNKFINMVVDYNKKGGDVEEFIQKISNAPMVDRDGNTVTVSAKELKDIIYSKEGNGPSIAEMLNNQNNLISQSKYNTAFSAEAARQMLRQVTLADGKTPMFSEEEISKMSTSQLKKKLKEIRDVTSDELLHRASEKINKSEEEKIADSTKSIEQSTKDILDILIKIASGETGKDFKESEYYKGLTEKIKERQREEIEKEMEGPVTTEYGSKIMNTIRGTVQATGIKKKKYSDDIQNIIKNYGLDIDKLDESTVDELTRENRSRTSRLMAKLGFKDTQYTDFQKLVMGANSEIVGPDGKKIKKSDFTEREINAASGDYNLLQNIGNLKKAFGSKEVSEDVIIKYGKLLGNAHYTKLMKAVAKNENIRHFTAYKVLTVDLLKKIDDAYKWGGNDWDSLVYEGSQEMVQRDYRNSKNAYIKSLFPTEMNEAQKHNARIAEAESNAWMPKVETQQNGIGTFLLGAIGGLGKLLFGGKKNDEEQSSGPMSLIRKIGGNMPFLGGAVADSDQSTIDSADNDGTSIVADSEGNAMKYKKKADGSTEPDTSDARTKAILNVKKAKEVALEKLQSAQLKASEAIHNAFDPEKFGGKKKGKFNIWHLIIAGILFAPVIKKLFNKLLLPLWTEHIHPFITNKVVPFVKEKVFPWISEKVTSIKNFVIDTAFPAVKNFFTETVLPAITDTVSKVGTWLLENGPRIIWAGIKGGASLVGAVADGVVGGDKYNAGGKTTVKSDAIKNNKEFTDKNGNLITSDLSEGDVVYNAKGDAGVVDANGNAVYTDKSKHGSTFLATVGKASGRSFLNGMISSAGVGGLLTKLGTKATTSGILGKAGSALSAVGNGAGFIPIIGTPAKYGLKTAGLSLKAGNKAVNISQSAGEKFQKLLYKFSGDEARDARAARFVEKFSKKSSNVINEAKDPRAARFAQKFGKKNSDIINEVAGNVDDAALHSVDEIAENPSFVGRVLKRIGEVVVKKISKACDTFFIAGKIRDIANAAKMSVKEFVDDFCSKLLKFISDHIPEAIKKDTKAAASALSSKEFLAMLGWVTMISDFITGMDQAESILGVKETNLISDVVCGLVNLVCGKIVILSIFPGLERICRFMYGLYSKFVGNDDYEKQKDEAEKSATEYNEKHGTTYSTEEYLSYTKSRSGKMWMDAKSLLNVVMHPIKSLKNIGETSKVFSGNSFIENFTKSYKLPLQFLGDELSKISIIQKAKNKLGDIFSIDNFNKVKNNMAGFVQNTATGLSGMVSNTANNMAGFVKNKAGDLSGMLSSAANGVVSLVSSPVIMIKSAVGGFIDKVKGELDSLSDNISEKDEIIEKAKNGEVSIFSKEYWTSGINKNDSFGSLLKSVSFITRRLIQAPMLLVKNFFGGIFSGVSSIIGLLTGTKSDASESVQQTMKNAGISNSYTENTSSSNTFNGSSLITTNTSSNASNSNATKSSGGIKGFFNSVTSTLSRAGQAFKSLFGKGKYGRGYSKQIDPSISNIRFNISGDTEYQTVGDSACGPAAAVNVLESVYGRGGNEVLSASKYALSRGYKEYNGGIRPTFFTDYFNRNGLNSQMTYNTNVLENNINSGMPTVLMGQDPRGVSSNTPFGKSPHYVTVTGTDGKGHAIVQDPESKYDNLLYDTKTLMRKTTLGVSAFGKNARSRRYLRPTSSKYDMPSARGKFGRGKAPTLDEMRAAGQQAVDYFRNNGYTYGNHRTCNPNELPPIVDLQEPKVVSCDRMVDSILYLLGFTDVGNRDVEVLMDWCRQKGFRENTSYSNIQPGDIIFYNGHVFIVGANLGGGLWERFDGGSTSRIVNPQPSHEGIDENKFVRSFSFVNLVAPDGSSTVTSTANTATTTTTMVDGTTTVTQEPQGDSIQSFFSGVTMNNRSGQLLTSLLGTGAAGVLLNHLSATGNGRLTRTNRHYLKPTSEEYDVPNSGRGSIIIPFNISATGNSARGQIYPFKHYNLSQDEAERFAAACVMEQGESPEAVRSEMSQILNLTESSYGNDYGNDPTKVLNSGWYASVTRERFADKRGSTPELTNVILDTANNGNRNLPPFIDEHDCFSDIISISTGSVRNKSDYIKDKTIIENENDSVYTFWDFPGTEDPFGYTAERKAEHDDWLAKGYVLPNGVGSPVSGTNMLSTNTGTVTTSTGSPSGLTFTGLTYKDKGKASNLINQSLSEYTANKANKKLTYDVNSKQWTSGNQASTNTAKGKYGRGKWGRGEAEIWNYLTQTLGFSENGAAAFMGNIVQESGLKSNNAENRVNKTGISDEEFTSQVNSGAISRDLFIQNPAYGGKGLYGYGLVQWTSPGRKGGMYDYVMGKYGDISSEAGQLEYIKQELENGYQNTYKAVTSPTMSLEEINRIVFKEYEGPGDNTEPVRLNAANDILTRYKGTIGNPLSQFANPINAAQNGGLVNAVQSNVSTGGDSIASFLSGTQNNSRTGQVLASLLGGSDSGSSGNTSTVAGNVSTATNTTGLSVGNSTTALGQPGALVSVAQSQVGYHEGAGNDTKYGDWYGLPGCEWCAMFVSWCANQAGIPTDTVPKGSYTPDIYDWYAAKNAEVNYNQAQPGDTILFYRNSAGRIRHIGLVEKGDGNGGITTIEGNHNDEVARVDYSAGDLDNDRGKAHIMRPAWTDVNSPITVQPDLTGVPSAAVTTTQSGSENYSASGTHSIKPMSKYGQFKNSIRISGRGNMDAHKAPYYTRYSPTRDKGQPTDVYDARPTSARGTAILPKTNIFNNNKDYTNLLNAIIQILSVIATNTDKLNTIIEILNDKLGINISANDIANKSKNDIATQISATLKTNNATSNLNSLLDGISNNELNNLIDTMNMLASA